MTSLNSHIRSPSLSVLNESCWSKQWQISHAYFSLLLDQGVKVVAVKSLESSSTRLLNNRMVRHNNTTQDEGIHALPWLIRWMRLFTAGKRSLGKSLLRSYVEEASLKSHRNHLKNRDQWSQKRQMMRRNRGKKITLEGCSKHRPYLLKVPSKSGPRGTLQHG